MLTCILSAGQQLLACRPAKRPGCPRYRAPRIKLNNSLLRPNYKTAVLKTTFLLRHGKSFFFPSTLSFLLIGNNLCHSNIPYKVHDNNSINMHAHVFSVIQAYLLWLRYIIVSIQYFLLLLVI